jgi:hypothetical protein
MSGQPPEQDQGSGGRPEPHDDAKRSGEGAQTALEALIRQRKLAEAPDAPEPPQPGLPAR